MKFGFRDGIIFSICESHLRSSSSMLKLRLLVITSVLIVHGIQALHVGLKIEITTEAGEDCGSSGNNLLKGPRYPSVYPDDNVCVYLVHIPHGMALNITFTDFYVEHNGTCSFDHVKITNSSNDIIGQYCGNMTGHTVLVTGDYAKLRFFTDSNKEFRGFLLYFQAVPRVFGRDCLDLLHKGYTEDGLYTINPDGKKFITVSCDQKTNGGGWVVFQRRLDGSVDFYRNWTNYKEGFGDLMTEFWLGNDDIHKVTKQGSQALIELKDFDNKTAHASYGSFHVGAEAENYVLHFAGFSGSAGDSMTIHNGMMFSTYDKDDDLYGQSCAREFKGAWWHNKCHLSNLNGQHGNNAFGKGINWKSWRGQSYSLKESVMKVRARREREWFYELIFSDTASDYVLLPRITDLKDVTSCWWIKTAAPADWSTVFSLYDYDNSSVLSFSYSGNGSYLFHVNNENRNFSGNGYVITDARWHHVCITRFSLQGSWEFYTDGVKKAEGAGLAANYSTGLGYLKIGGFEGSLTSFNMWDEYINNTSRIENLAHACSSMTGNIVPWPEVQLWRVGNVGKKNSSLCKFSETYHWTFEQLDSKSLRTYDGISGRRGTEHSKHKWWYTKKGVASKTGYDFLKLDSYKSECVSDPNLCPQGLSLSFWLRYRPRFISKMQGFTDEQDTILGSWLDAALPSHGKWYPCFRSFGAWKGNNMHHYCDGKGPTVTLIRVQESIFGGFLDTHWGGLDGFLQGKKAFIFSLKNERGLSPFKMDLKTNKSDKAAKQILRSGPIFGEGDITIGVYASTSAASWTDLDRSYEFPSGLSLSSDEQDRLLAGSERFIVDEMEVFYYRVPWHHLHVKDQNKFSDSRFNASSFLEETNSTGRPEHAILNSQNGSWCPFKKSANEWLELDLGSDQTIYGVAVQGSHDSDSKVTKYNFTLRASADPEGTVFETISNGSADYFYSAQYSARYIRFTVKAFNVSACMRVGVIKEYCSPGWSYFQGSCYLISSTAKSWSDSQTHCLSENAHLVNIGTAMENDFINSQISDRSWLGLKEVPGNRLNWIDDGSEPGYVNWNGGQPVYQNGRDDCIYTQSGTWTADDCGQSLQFVCEKVLETHAVTQWSSSSWQCMTTPELARLGLKTNCHSSWCGSVGDWLQIDLGKDRNVGLISTQGAYDDFGFVKLFKLSYKPSAGTWQDYREQGESTAKVFSGNWNGNTVVSHNLNPPVKANFLRFYPTECMTPDRCCMRVDIMEAAYCPSGWEYFQGSCYLLTSYDRSFQDSMAICRSKGADLIKISSLEENQFVQRDGGWWLGLHRDAVNKNIFKWNDGSLSKTAFTNWRSGEPNNALEECVEYYNNGEWNDKPCNALGSTACEKENIDVILTTRGTSECNPGILFGYHEFTGTYRLSVSTSKQNWELRLPNSSLGWAHVGITWSIHWGLRFYRNGVLVAEATNPINLPYGHYDQLTNFRIGRDTSSVPLIWGNHFQMSDLRIWESSISQQKLQEIHSNAVLPWYMWENKGSAIFHWKLKHVCQGNLQDDSCDVEHYLRRDLEYRHIGCFRIDSGPVITSIEGTDPILDGNFKLRTNATLKCLNAARRKGNGMFALKDGGNCLSSSISDIDVITKYKVGDDCEKYKGSANSMNIYILKDNYNVAYKKPTSQSGVVRDSSLATDGSRMDTSKEKCSLTTSQKDPWWRVDLEKEVLVRDIYIFIYSDSNVDYLMEIRIGNYDAPNLKENSLCAGTFSFKNEAWRRIRCPVPLRGRYVIIRRLVDNGNLMLCEVEVRQETIDYVQINMSYPRARGDLSILESQYVVGAVNCLNFSYNMTGENVGRLNVYIVGQDSTESLLWRLAGNQSNEWKSGQVPIDVAEGFKIKFESVSDDGNIGEISIRDIRLGVNSSCACVPTKACRQLTGFHSTMIRHIPSYQDALMGWLAAAGFGDKYWVPCFHGEHNSVFHSKCDQRGPTVTLARKDSYLFGGFADRSWRNYHPARKIPSTKAFLFSLKPFNINYGPTKFDLAADKRNQAIRSEKNRGPCWGYDTQELGFSGRTVKINPNGVFNYIGISSPSTFFTGQSDFKADDLEVFTISDSLCDPPCWEYEICDEIKGKCVCDPNFRGEEICRLRQVYQSSLDVTELQGKRDKYCNEECNSCNNQNCKGRLLARYDGNLGKLNQRQWRCYVHEALGRDRLRFDSTKGSNCYYTRHNELVRFSNEDCRALGMEGGNISDEQITASTTHSSMFVPRNARLNYQGDYGRKGGWVSSHNDYNQWLQVDFIKKVKLDKVATQGRHNYNQWVISYSLSYSMDGNNFQLYKQCGEVQLFDGNSDRDTIVYHIINPAIFTRYIRILPKAWKDRIAIRVEFYECHGYDGLESDHLLSDAKYLWTFDNVDNIKDQKGKSWAQISSSLQLQSAAGVRGQAVKISSGEGPIRLAEDTQLHLALPVSKKAVTVSLWLFYQSKGPGVAQTFFAVGGQENGDRGVHLLQEDGSSEEVTFNITSSAKSCSYKFAVPQRVWAHLVFIWSQSTGIGGTKVYRNGKVITDVAKHCISDSFADLSDQYIKLGSSQMPFASFDDLVILGKELSELQVDRLFRFYKGGANLYVNVSIELTSEKLHSELKKKGSEIFINKTSWIETQVRSLFDENSILKVDNFLFWNNTHLVAKFTVRFKGTGYKEIQLLETNLASRGMLGNAPVKLISMTANDVYRKSLEVSASNTSSTTLVVKWNEPGQLTHGIFCGVEISYRLNGSSEKSSVAVTSGLTEYELTNLQPYTLYAISVTPFTLEGEGKESEEILARTGEDVPTSPPLNVKGFLNDSGNIMVTWEPLPVQHRQGVIQGYHVMYTAGNNGQQHNVTVGGVSLSAELINILKGMRYSITVAAYNAAGSGPSSSAIVVRSEDGVPSVPPPIIVAHGISFSSIMVTWKAIPEDRAHGTIQGYVVKLDGTEDEIFVCPSPLKMTIGGLEKSNVYRLQMAGYTSKGQGNFSAYVLAITNIDGCRALGMEDGNISDSQITASSEHYSYHLAIYARLNRPVFWATKGRIIGHWLQVNFQEEVTVTKVATQGRPLGSGGNLQWVTTYSLNYSRNGVAFQVHKQFGAVKIFQGNWDSDTIVYNTVTPPITARYIRILPLSWYGHISMRTEFYTCEYDFKIEPVNITSSIQNTSSVGLSWNAPDPYKLGEAISEYRVEIIDLLRGENFNYTVNSSMTNVELDFLKPFTSYEFKVFGSTSSWQGNITDTISLKTQEDAPSEPPRNLSVQHSTVSQTTLQWKPVHEYSINGMLQGYKVRYKQTESPAWKTIVLNVNATQQSRRKRSVADGAVTFNLGGLKAYTNYTVIVLAFTIKDGVPTLATNFTTAQSVPDYPPTNVTAYNTSSTSINVTWQPIPPGHVNGMLLGYHVIYRRVDKANDNISIKMVNGTSPNTELTGLGKYKLYSIQIAGRTAAGLGNFSDAVVARTEQDVPDDPPGNIRALGTEPTVIKAHWLPVSNETINGIGLGYKLALFTTAGLNIRNYTLNASVLSLEITGLEIWTNYSIKMSAFTIVGDGPWSDALREDTDEQAPYKPPGNLAGKATSSTSISIEWDPVSLPNIRGILRGYAVYYQEAAGSVHPSVLRNVTVDISVTDAQLVNLHKYTEYHIWVRAFTTREGWLSNSIFVRTHEDCPERPPLYITYSSPSSTSILIHWGSVPPQFKNGIIRGFKVEYQEDQPGATGEVRERRLVNWALLGELKKFTIYSIRVRAFTSIGYGPENNITVLTAQDVPSKPPNGINAESHVTLTTIPVTWQPIDPYHIHGVLLGYKIRYQAVAIGQEPVEDQPIGEERVNPSTLSVVLTNLEIFTLYRVDVLGYTIMGNGPSATDYAETCRCHKRLTTSWYEFRPYVQVSENKVPSGLIPPILSKLVVTCCETCQAHGTSYVDFSSNGFNQSAELPSLRKLKSSIANPTDFFFPVYGFKDQTHFAREFGYHGLVESPGMAYIVNTNSHDDMPNAVLANILSCWPALTLFMAITYLSGLAVWSVESRCNPEDFPPSFIQGASEGFYWAFVSTTTVGLIHRYSGNRTPISIIRFLAIFVIAVHRYGDRAPISFIGRFLAIVVILSGLVIFGLVNGIMATSITSVTLETDYKIYGAKVAAIEGTPEYRMGIRKNAKMDRDQECHTFEDIYTALHERKVIGALIDTYSAGNSKDMFAKEHLRVNKILDYSSTYGVVMGKEARKLRMCFKDFTQHAFASEISHHIQKNTEQLKEPSEPLPVERSTGLFDSHSAVFQNTLLISSTLLISCLLIGVIYEIIRRVRARTQVQPHDLRKTFAAELKEMLKTFNENMTTIVSTMVSRHEKERKKFLNSWILHPRRKYEHRASTAALTEELYFTPSPEEPETNC